jgi:hypothetical protein
VLLGTLGMLRDVRELRQEANAAFGLSLGETLMAALAIIFLLVVARLVWRLRAAYRETEKVGGSEDARRKRRTLVSGLLLAGEAVRGGLPITSDANDLEDAAIRWRSG